MKGITTHVLNALNT